MRENTSTLLIQFLQWVPYNASDNNLGFYSIEMGEEKDPAIQEIALSISISAKIKDESIIKILGNKIKIVKIRFSINLYQTHRFASKSIPETYPHPFILCRAYAHCI